uniref:Reverse transcriptase domain-containing protein n=1 Tax=Nicotiana tabacum TaxID=4097 RepID=A0A1S4BDP8_TOBAC|nr:PREDICTED: uncharacterized protein LOC107807199 [Nicotiana tabacum]
MPHDKAPGVDGFPNEFFTKHWEVGNDICDATRQFFTTGEMHRGINGTAVTLIPKVQNPSHVKDYRPIACCTTLYKIITNVLTARTKKVIGGLIGESQSAFIEGRSITHNILFTHRTLDNGMHYNTGLLSYHEWWIDNTFQRKEGNQARRPYVSLSICPGNGVSIEGVCTAEISSIRLLQHTFLKFSNASGLQENADKSSIYLAIISNNLKQDILQELGYSEGTLPFRYFGVPLASKKLSVIQCWPLVEKITRRINCWTAKLLSYAVDYS